MGNKQSSDKKSKKRKEKKNSKSRKTKRNKNKHKRTMSQTDGNSNNHRSRRAGKTHTRTLTTPIETILANHSLGDKKSRPLPSLPPFGAPLSKQVLIEVKDNELEFYGNVPAILVLLKKYLFQFNGNKCIGIFANGSINEDAINKSPQFFENGIVSKADCNGVKQLIESNKITQNKFMLRNYNNNEKYYAMIFAELIKLWLHSLQQPLLQDMPSTFFDDISSVQFLEFDIDKIAEPNLSTLLFIWDICVQIDADHEINKMSIDKLSAIFGPFMYVDKNAERNEQLRPVLINFCQIGMQWRKNISTCC